MLSIQSLSRNPAESWANRWSRGRPNPAETFSSEEKAFKYCYLRQRSNHRQHQQPLPSRRRIHPSPSPAWSDCRLSSMSSLVLLFKIWKLGQSAEGSLHLLIFLLGLSRIKMIDKVPRLPDSWPFLPLRRTNSPPDHPNWRWSYAECADKLVVFIDHSLLIPNPCSMLFRCSLLGIYGV